MSSIFKKVIAGLESSSVNITISPEDEIEIKLGHELQDAINDVDTQAKEVQQTEEDIDDAVDKAEALESIIDTIEMIAPTQLDANGEPETTEVGDTVKMLDVDMLPEHRVLLTSVTKLAGKDVEPRDILGEAALDINEDKSIATESMYPVTYRVAMESAGSILNNLYRTILNAIKAAMNFIKDLSVKVFNVFPIISKNLKYILDLATKYQNEGYVLKDGESSYEIKNTKPYSIDYEKVASDGRDLKIELDSCNKFLTYLNSGDANKDISEKIISIKLATDIINILSNFKKSDYESGDDKQNLRDNLNKIGDELIKDINGYTPQTSGRKFDGSDDTKVTINAVPHILDAISLGGFYIGRVDFSLQNSVLKSKNEVVNVLKNKITSDSTIKEITDYGIALMDGLKYMKSYSAIKCGKSDVQKDSNSKFETLKLENIKLLAEQSLKTIDGVLKFRTGSYITNRNKVLVDMEKMLTGGQKDLEESNSSSTVINDFTKIMKNSINSNNKEITAPMLYFKTAMQSMLYILNENIGKYHKENKDVSQA